MSAPSHLGDNVEIYSAIVCTVLVPQAWLHEFISLMACLKVNFLTFQEIEVVSIWILPTPLDFKAELNLSPSTTTYS
jgi:hypothetical protein